mmetsp:Transcript_15710/g.2607  ORF Transcript_15710/g.2607 Transcript_15710/m.2607 type:complete len:82 (-) Transcript_15710:16-261(-)
MFPPSQVLHLSNLSDNLTESFLRELFQDQAYMTEFRFIGDQRRMALAKFHSVEDAIKVLVAYHNKNLNGRYLKIAFSKALM